MHGSIFKNMLILASGSGAAKAIAFLFTPLITRIYSPEDFGLFTIFLAATTLATPLTSLRYSAALPLPKRIDIASNLLAACFSILLITCIFFSAILFFFSTPLFSFFSASGLEKIWPFLILSIALAGSYEILCSWAVRSKSFKKIAKTEITISTTGSLLKLLLSALDFTKTGLIFGHLLGQAAGVSILANNAWSQVNQYRHRINIRNIILVLKRYIDFPKYRFASQIFLSFAAQAPIFFISAQQGPSVAGQLGLAFTVLAIPITLLVQTTAQAYYAEIAQIGQNKPEEIKAISRSIAKKLFILGLPPTIILILGGPILFTTIFGSHWHQAGVFSSMLAIYLLAQFVSNPLSNALNVLNRQKLNLVLDATRATISCGVFIASQILNLSPESSILIYSISLAAYYLINISTIFKALNTSIEQKTKNKNIDTLSN